MLKYLVYLDLILSVAMTAGGIILSSRLRKRYKSDTFSTLLYYQIFISAFGFYAIWGQIVIKVFIAQYISQELLLRFTGIAMLLGLPFLVFAWLMLIQFTAMISGRKTSGWSVFAFLLGNFSILVLIGYLISSRDIKDSTSLIKNYYIVMNVIWSLLASYLIHLPIKGKETIHEYDRSIIAPTISIISLTQCIPLVFYTSQPWIGLIFIFGFFLGNTFLPIYFSYQALLPASSTEPATDLSFEEFCKKFEVSPRESDIVREICNGLSNKEISEKLFISLQTVKDHSHRIYIKTNVKSRVQLINLVKEEVQATGAGHQASGIKKQEML
jgi:DNA-binding CsgD family transcriptional regulator